MDWVLRDRLNDFYQESWPFKCQPLKMVSHTQTIRRFLLTNCLSVFDHFVGLARKGLTSPRYVFMLDHFISLGSLIPFLNLQIQFWIFKRIQSRVENSHEHTCDWVFLKKVAERLFSTNFTWSLGFHKTFWGTTKKCENKNLTFYINTTFRNARDVKV